MFEKILALNQGFKLFINYAFRYVFSLFSEGEFMPNNEEHCQHTLRRYGVRGEDIHVFLDEPCRIAGQGHRTFRHDTKTIKLVGEIFGKKYGRELAENIALDHITADHEERIKKRNSELLLIKCPNCGAQLTKGQGDIRTCEYCSYQTKIPNINESYNNVDSIKLPGIHTECLLYRRSDDQSLPLVLPLLYINGYFQRGSGKGKIDEVYAEFEDKPMVEMLLEHALDYYPATVGDLRLDEFGNRTKNEIKTLILQSKSVTKEEIKELLQRPEVKQFREIYEQEVLKDAKKQSLNKYLKFLFPFVVALGGFVLSNPMDNGLSFLTLVLTFSGFMVGFMFISFLSLLIINPSDKRNDLVWKIKKAIKTSKNEDRFVI